MNFLYLRYVRYIAFFVTLAFLIFAFNVYMANHQLDTKIKQIQQEIEEYKQKKWYYENFLIPFYQSETGKMIFFHKSGIPMPDEKVIIIDYQHTKQNINTGHSNQEIDNITLWYQFLKQKVISRIFSHDN